MSGAAAERGGPAGAVWVVVLAGGVGSRFWPLSTPERPKQLLPLVTSEPMLRDTLDRVSALAPVERTLILTNAALAAAVRRIAPELPPGNVIGEPRAAGTAAALAWAAHEIARRGGRDAVMLSVHADAAIGDVAAFRTTLLQAAGAAATAHGLVTIGIVPRFADTGLGYIEPGAVVSGSLAARHAFHRETGSHARRGDGRRRLLVERRHLRVARRRPPGRTARALPGDRERAGRESHEPRRRSSARSRIRSRSTWACSNGAAA